MSGADSPVHQLVEDEGGGEVGEVEDGKSGKEPE